MWHLLIVVSLVLHGIGHAAGFWLPVPRWFALAWLVPGIAFLVGGWGYQRGSGWWPVLTVIASAGSLLLTLAVGPLQPGPLASAFAFDLAVIAALLLPWSRHVILGR